MKEYRMLEAVGGIRPEFIEEGLTGTGTRRGKAKRALLWAAALLLVCLSLSGLGALTAPDYVKGIFRDIFAFLIPFIRPRGLFTADSHIDRGSEASVSGNDMHFGLAGSTRFQAALQPVRSDLQDSFILDLPFDTLVCGIRRLYGSVYGHLVSGIHGQIPGVDLHGLRRNDGVGIKWIHGAAAFPVFRQVGQPVPVVITLLRSETAPSSATAASAI